MVGVWYGMVPVCNVMIWHGGGMIWQGMVGYGNAWHGMIGLWYGMTWHGRGMEQHDMA